MKIQGNQFLSIEQLQDQYLQKSKPVQTSDAKGISFQDILLQKSGMVSEELKFSKHASNRLLDRNIQLTDNQLERLNSGTRKAGEKGIHESLVIVDQLAFIVNVPNNTVITAMDQTEARDNIFTNIDGAVIM
ncbi:MAG: flagellar protein [Lachnospiraceae bacterium]|nr:flagellar protein [Lachnospiraceae bacterium]